MFLEAVLDAVLAPGLLVGSNLCVVKYNTSNLLGAHLVRVRLLDTTADSKPKPSVATALITHSTRLALFV